MTVSGRKTAETPQIDVSSLDLSTTVGHIVKLYTEQLPGRPVSARVVQAGEGVMSVGRGGGDALVDNLIHNQGVVVRFGYKGEEISVAARLKKCMGGQVNLFLGGRAVPLSRRRFVRLDRPCSVKLAVLPASGVNYKTLSRLRWLQAESFNLSSGGLLLDLSSALESNTTILMNVEYKSPHLPPLVLGQVKHNFPCEPGHFRTGVEFIVREDKEKFTAKAPATVLPPVVFDYTSAGRNRFNESLLVAMQDDEYKE